jgi:hypothetical protein
VAARVAVVGRYGGVVGVLAELIRGAGTPVAAAAALDADGRDAVLAAVAAADVVVCTTGPGDPTAAAAVTAPAVVAVTWHPPDERPPLPPRAVVVPAGRIRADLGGAVARAAATGAR